MVRNYMLAAAISLLAAWGWGVYQHGNGWSEGRAALVQEQQTKAAQRQAKLVAQQQQDDSRAAAADQAGAAKTITITNEVIRYVKTPGRNVCTFDADRVRLKADAVNNANRITGFDDNAVQAPAAERGSR